MPTVPPVRPKTPLTAEEALAAAEAVAERICAGAIWSAERCTWTVSATGPGGHVRPAPAAGNLYDGTSGIALFLLRLGSVLPKAHYLETARGALRHALAEEAQAPRAAAGFYGGTAGIAAACAAMSEVDGGGPWRREALRLCDTIAAGFVKDGAYDLVSGEAGAILGLLQVHEATGADAVLATARRLGQVLVEQARPEPGGVSWDVMHPAVLRNVLGLSHGAGGIALALLELYGRTGDSPLLETALQAIAYEDGFLVEAARNWPDLRDAKLSQYLAEGRGRELRQELAAGTFPVASPGMMTAWCHGAPGIALVRARFYAATGAERFRRTLTVAAEGTLPSLVPGGGSHCLCHGLLGNAEALLEAARGLDRPDLTAAALELARAEMQTAHTGAPWRSGNPTGAPTPGLLLGDAGVGMFFLRLARPGLPSVLLPVSRRQPSHPVVGADARWAEAERAALLRHFPRTRRAVEGAGGDLAALDPVRGDLAAQLAALVASLRVGSVREAFDLESLAFSLLREHGPYSACYERSLMRRPPEALEDLSIPVRLAAASRLFSARHDWEALLAPGASLSDVPEQPTEYLVFEAGHGFRIRRLAPLAAAIYRSLEEARPVAEVVARAVASLVAAGLLDSAEGLEADEARVRVRRALHTAYVSELIEVAEPDLIPGDIGSDLCIRCGECCRVRIYIPADEAYGAFLKEMLEVPLRSTYPDAVVRVGGEAGEGQVLLDLGYCRHLHRGQAVDGTPTFHCGIYETRPETCRSFNCVSWWRLQKVGSANATASDRLMQHVLSLKAPPR